MTRRTRALAALVVAALAGCGLGHSQGDATDGGAVSPGGGPCPASLPNAGAPCSLATTIACEYGGDANGACNAIAFCSGARQWSLKSPFPPPSCPTPGAAGACPATYAGVSIGADCASHDLACGYPEGRCACLQPTSGPPRADGGYQWACDRPAAGCPLPRPRLGSACSAAAVQTCDYGGCSMPGGVAESCQDGVWSPVESACPL